MVNKKFLGKINNKFLFIFSFILIAIILIGVLIVYFQNQVLEEQFKSAITETEEDFFDIQEESTRTLSVALEVVLQDEGMKQIYLEKDRDKFFEYGQPLFNELKNKYQITHFYFILPDGTNFVRLHNKEVYGDEIKRATFLKARETKDVGAGIELGKTAYALRVVKPYYSGDELIGYVELGQEIEEFLGIMKKGKLNEFSLVVEKDSLIEEDWVLVRKVKGLENNWDDLKDHVVISSTTEEIFSCFSDENTNILQEQTLFIERSSFEDSVFACGGFSLVDAGGKNSGIMFSLIDVTKEQTNISKIRYVLLTILGIVVVLFIGAGRYVSNKISKPIIKLKQATDQIKEKNFGARVNIRTNDELGELGQSFNETAKVLENMDAQHKQLEKAKTEFLSITSHELRSPMTPMQAQLQMLIGEYYGKLNPKQKNALEIVSRNTKRLDNIIIDFLEISRIEAARLKFRFSKKDLTPYIKRLAKEMTGLMPEKKIKIFTKIGKLPVINVDPDRVMQILRNLINNAIKFSSEGKKIVISAKLDNGRILFSVSDQGIGIKSGDQKRIFEPFFQAEQTMYREHQGTGLGLAIVRGIVESQNGKVWLKSETGKGTNFYFTIPLKPVKVIQPIKLLFSEQKDISKKIKNIFVESLGPMGLQEFEAVKNENKLDKKDLILYISLLIKKGILNEEKGEVFKREILNLFGEKKDLVGTKELIEQGLIKKEPGKIVEKLRGQKFVQDKKEDEK
jgi:signal transduction histidine kinase